MANFCHNCGTASHSTTKGEERKTARKAYEPKKAKRAPSAHNKAYSKAFKKVESKFKKKGGGWKKDGFKRAGAAARRSMK
jgi:DNA-directed RNA polymerase subunit M/transcription elongation factor TFIIS